MAFSVNDCLVESLRISREMIEILHGESLLKTKFHQFGATQTRIKLRQSWQLHLLS